VGLEINISAVYHPFDLHWLSTIAEWETLTDVNLGTGVHAARTVVAAINVQFIFICCERLIAFYLLACQQQSQFKLFPLVFRSTRSKLKRFDSDND